MHDRCVAADDCENKYALSALSMTPHSLEEN